MCIRDRLWVVTWLGVLLSLKSNAVDVSGNDVFAELGLFDGLSHKLRDLLDFPVRLYRVYDPLLGLIIGISKLEEPRAYGLRSHATGRFAAHEGAGHITCIEIHDRVQIYNDRISRVHNPVRDISVQAERALTRVNKGEKPQTLRTRLSQGVFSLSGNVVLRCSSDERICCCHHPELCGVSGLFHTRNFVSRLHHAKLAHDLVVLDHIDLGMSFLNRNTSNPGAVCVSKPTVALRRSLSRIALKKFCISSLTLLQPRTSFTHVLARTCSTSGWNTMIVGSASFVEQHSSLPPIISRDVIVVLSPCNKHRIDALCAHKLLNLLFSFAIDRHFFSEHR